MNEFLAWFERQKAQVFDKRRILESYFPDDVSVLREACPVLRQEFIQLGNIDVFLEFVIIASECTKVMRKRFLKPKTIGLIPSVWYKQRQLQ